MLIPRLAVSLFAVMSAAAIEVDRVIAFGDSLSDVGNVFSLSGGFVPNDPYFPGRFSNGPVWLEHVADGLGVGPISATAAGGTNAAYGGATSADTYQIFGGALLPNLGRQVADYIQTDTFGPRDLIAIWAGSNDLFNDPGLNPAIPATNIGRDIDRLALAGATQFLVLNIPPLGATPRGARENRVTSLNRRSAETNAALDGELAARRNGLGVTIIEFDVAALFDDLLTNPAAFGFSNITDVAYDGIRAVPNPDDYLFWDPLHPTGAAHALLGDAVLAAVPEPAALLPLVVGVLAAARRP